LLASYDDNQEVTLTEVSEYVLLVVAHVEQVVFAQPVINHFADLLVSQWLLEGGSPREAAFALLDLLHTAIFPSSNGRSLYELSYYVRDVTTELETFGFDRMSANEIVDDYDTDVATWCLRVPPRAAARRLAGRQLAA